MLKVGKQERVDSMRPSPLVVDDDVRAKTWGPGSPLLHVRVCARVCVCLFVGLGVC